MTFIIATIVIAVGYGVFHPLLNGVFHTLLLLLTAKVGGGDHEQQGLTNALAGNFRLAVVLPIFSALCIFLLLYLLYFLFVKYDFGYAISALVGAAFALCQVSVDILPKIAALLFRKR